MLPTSKHLLFNWTSLIICPKQVAARVKYSKNVVWSWNASSNWSAKLPSPPLNINLQKLFKFWHGPQIKVPCQVRPLDIYKMIEPTRMLTILRSMANLIISSFLFLHVRLGKGKTGTLPQRPCKSWFTPVFTGDVVNCKCQQITMPKSVKRDLCDIRFEEKRFIVWQNLGFPLSLWPDRKLLSSWIRPLSSGNLHLDENICFCIFSFFIYLHF